MTIAWHDRVSFSSGDEGAVVAGPGARLSMRSVAPEILAAFERLAPPGEAEETLADSILTKGNADSLARWYFHVDQFRRRGLVRRTLLADGRRLATLLPLSHAIPSPAVGNSQTSPRRTRTTSQTRNQTQTPLVDVRYLLSRFAYLRQDEGEMVLELPLSHSRLVLHDPLAVCVVASLAAPIALADLCDRNSLLAPAAISHLIGLLHDAAMIDVNSAGGDEEHADARFESWEFHDLLFHSRSRRGRSDAEFGATYRFRHRPAPPALKSIEAGETCNLYRPDLAQLERDDPPFAAVQNRRRSLRKYGAIPITAEQLGEFLYRVGRVTGTWAAEIPEAEPQATMEFAGRPYPAGGALYELEMYPIVRSCRDLAAGLYAYAPAEHRLHRIAGQTPEVESLLDEAASSAGVDPQSVQVLICLASRFERIAWKYESIAYALTLKHVGVVYQTMYLAATAMGLAPCAVGCGDSDLFVRAAGTEYHVESSVGEFLLGSRE